MKCKRGRLLRLEKQPLKIDYLFSCYRNIGAAAADRAKIQQEFFVRKQEAAANRIKAQGGFIGNNVRAEHSILLLALPECQLDTIYLCSSVQL